jgi:hypothetical protein
VVFALSSVSSPGASLVFTNERLQYFDDAEVTHLSVTGLPGLPQCYGDSCLDFPYTFEMRCLEIQPAPCHVSLRLGYEGTTIVVLA